MVDELLGVEALEKRTGQNKSIAAHFAEVGSSGLERSGGAIQEEFLTALTMPGCLKVYQEMSWNDPVIGAVLFVFEELARRCQWPVEAGGNKPIDLEAKKFVEECRDDMEQSFSNYITEILSMFVYGWSLHEVVYKLRRGYNRNPKFNSKFNDGKIGWRSIPGRSQSSWNDWKYNEDTGELEFFEQLVPSTGGVVSIPMSKCLLFRTKADRNNPEGRSLLRTAWRCLSDDTEILTPDGWKDIDTLNTKDAIYTLNSDTDTIETEKVKQVNIYDYDGELIHANSRFIDMLVTPNHRMWVRKHHKKDFEFIEADKCLRSYSSLSIGNLNIKNNNNKIILGTKEIEIDLWAKFLGIWISEGHSWGAKKGSTNPNKREVGICQKNKKVSAKIRQLLIRLPWSFSERKDKRGITRWISTRRELYNQVYYLGKSINKFIPKYVFSWDKKSIKTFLHYFFLGDGFISGGRSGYKGTKTLLTASKQLADDLMHLGFLAGYRPSLRIQTEFSEARFSQNPLYIVTLGKNFTNRMMAKWSKEKYKGRVYCPTTKNGIIYVRRNGKCTWTGNSWIFKKNIEEIEAIGIERDLAGFPVMQAAEGIDIWNANNPESVALKATVEQIVANVRMDKNLGLVLPSGWDFKLVSSGGGKQIDTNAVINRIDQRIAATLLADIVMLGADKVGSFALADVKKSLLASALEAQVRVIAEIFNKHAVPTLLELNNFKGLTDFPKFVPSEIEVPDINSLTDFLTKLSKLGVVLFPDEKLERYLASSAGLPEGSIDSKKKGTKDPDMSDQKIKVALEENKKTPTKEGNPSDDKTKFNQIYDEGGRK